nr:unnamed protein product [Digitaria exilis]
MAHPRFPLLELAYADTHRAHMIADQNMPLRPVRASGWFSPHSEDGLYGPTPMDGALLTALVDRWRPETHTFHLPCGEMTVTLEDMAMITALHFEGAVVTGMIQSEGWQDMHFNVCPADADDDIVERHARVWLWHFVSSFLFPDAAGSTLDDLSVRLHRRYTAYTNEIDCLTGNQNDWRVTHQDYLHMWEQRQRHNITEGEDWFAGENQHYLLWFHRVARTRLRPTAMEYNMEDVDTDAEDDYDVDTRWGNQPERAPLHDHMGRQLSRIVNDAGVAMRHGNDARFLNCVTANPVDPARAPGGSYDSQPTPIHSAPGGSSAMAGPSSSHRAGKAPASPQASDEDVPGDDSEDSPAPGPRESQAR